MAFELTNRAGLTTPPYNFKDMAKKTITFRFDEAKLNQLTNGGEINPSEAFEKLMDDALTEKRIKMNDIRGIFTENEWKGLANSLNGTIIDDIMRYSPEMLIAHCEDAELYETSFSLMEADVKSVCEKIKGITKIQVSSVLDRVAEFWNNQNGTGIELDKWAKW